MQTRHFWIFTTGYWVLAGLLMFIGALSVDHWPIVVMRFLYFPMLGFVLTAAMTLAFQSASFRALRHPIPAVLVLCGAAALFTALILNPLTYLLVGVDLMEDHIAKMTRGVHEFGVAYLLWTVLYFELDGRPLLGPRVPRAGHLDRMDVDDRGSGGTVPSHEIECIEASGDYVHLHLAGRSYLRKATLSSIEAMLDPERFRRVHRSLLVNADAVVDGRHKGSGSYLLTLASGREVASSRSYRPTVQALLAARPMSSVDDE